MKKNHFIVALIFLIFFVISFLTNILGPLIPDIISGFGLSMGLAGFLPFAFFVAYGVMSIPAGLLVDRYSEKRVLFWAFLLACAGSLFFVIVPGFSVAMISLFLIGVGMAMLQVVINPLLRQAGGEETFAFNSVLAQLFFGGASFLSPMLYSYLVKNIHADNRAPWIMMLNALVPVDLKWISLYWIIFLTACIMVVIIKLVRFPVVVLRADERIEMGKAFKELLSNKYVWLYFMGIFSYVGTEQGIANWISSFLKEYHGVSPETMGASVISDFWGLLTIGCLLGLVLLKMVDSKKVLVFFSAGAMLSLGLALFSNQQIACYAFPLTGFFASVMWSVIVSLALNSVTAHHGTFSGILCTGIVGGAIVPLLIGGLADVLGLRYAMLFLFIPLLYIFSIGFWAKPVVRNATVKNWKELFS